MSGTFDNPEIVVRRAAEVADLATKVCAWLEQNKANLQTDPGPLIRDFRRASRHAMRLSMAANRPVGVSVFGASQAGKSYLVSTLCGSGGESMQARFGATVLDFLKDINPPGGQEATGLVSRFTTSPPPTPPGADVALRLLSQTDIIRILANTYLKDFVVDAAPPTPDALGALFATATDRAGQLARDGLTSGDVEDLVEYFERHFHDKNLIKDLGAAGYWRQVVDLAPRLPAGERAALFSPLWGQMPEFTAVCQTLFAALADLKFAADAFCGLDSLQPRDTSIIDVRILFMMGNKDPKLQLAVQTADGVKAMLYRPHLAALVAEVIVPIVGRSYDFLANADLLDFPGARTREEITDLKFFFSKSDNLGRAFLRGKVAYLYQRYNADQEIAAMLLCVGPGNQDVQTLPQMVNDWIAATIGATPEARVQQRNSLFFVLTKFDAEFEVKAGENMTDGMRWAARLQASLLDFFGKSYDWPNNWAGEPFNNLFWLRNTAIAFQAVMAYGDDKRECSIRPDAQADVNVRRQAFLDNDLVGTYFKDPAAAWDAALLPNDGGISRLAGALAPVCVRALKTRQLSARAEELAHGVYDRLRGHWRSDNRDAEIAQAKQRAGQIFVALKDVVRYQSLGSLLLRLCVTSELISSVLWRMEMEPEDKIDIGVHGGEIGIPDFLQDLSLQDTKITAKDRFTRFADMLLAAWHEDLISLTRDDVYLGNVKLGPEHCVVLVEALVSGARRLDLHDKLAARLRKAGLFQGAIAAGSAKMVRQAEEMIGNFVTYLGYDATPEEKRMKAGNPPRPLFAARPAVQGVPPLGNVPTAYDVKFYEDWMTGVAAMVIANAESGAGMNFDRAANDELGKLLKRLVPQEPA